MLQNIVSISFAISALFIGMRIGKTALAYFNTPSPTPGPLNVDHGIGTTPAVIDPNKPGTDSGSGGGSVGSGGSLIAISDPMVLDNQPGPAQLADNFLQDVPAHVPISSGGIVPQDSSVLALETPITVTGVGDKFSAFTF